MSKAGGIIGIIAGVFGFIAAGVTLFLGGIGSAFEAEGAKTVVGLGWGGVLFSFLTIVFGAVAISRSRWAGIALIVSSILGAFLGGTLVAICMALSLIGGILAVIGAKKDAPMPQETEPARAPSVTAGASRKKLFWILGSIGMFLILSGIVALTGKDEIKPKADPIAQLASTQPADLKADGELSEIFTFDSKYTDLQRDNKAKEIIGKVVQWQLPVYEVSKSGDGYKVQTQSQIGFGGFARNFVGTFVYITPRTDEDRHIIEGLKTGDIISFKGRINGTSLRSLTVKPAIIVHDSMLGLSSDAPAPVSPPTDTLSVPADSSSIDLPALRQSFTGADQEINTVYRETMSKFSPGAKAELKREQLTWIRKKESACNAEIEEAKRLQCLIRMTRERTEELKKYNTVN